MTLALWGSRFGKPMTADTISYTHTINIDDRMIVHDLWGSMSHMLMLCACGIVPENHGRRVVNALLSLINEAGRGELVLQKHLEDVHLNIEDRLIHLTSRDVGGRLNTARSRNDQVVTDSRLFTRENLLALGRQLGNLVETLLDKAEEKAESLTLGYTHSQAAQPITIGFWLSAHASAFLRDMERIVNATRCVNQNPLGGCALAGTSFPIDRTLTTRLLGFDREVRHALDATSARDYIAEAASACALLMSQISRLAEEVVVWSSFDVGLVKVDDSYSTGSSIMPQKKNPVIAELARARAATVAGCLTEILGVIKSVSMGYSCDLQQDKPPLWRAFDTTQDTVSIFVPLVATLNFDLSRSEEKCWRSFSTATELANYLVAAHGAAFREAYAVTGALVRELEAEGLTLQDTDEVRSRLAAMGTRLEPHEIATCVDPYSALSRQTSQGATSPDEVRRTVAFVREELARRRQDFARIADRVDRAWQRTVEIAQVFASGELPATALRPEVERVPLVQP